MSVLDHGESVHRYYLDLYDHIQHGEPLKYQWKLPAWIQEQALWERAISIETLSLYHTYHDCGKPVCLEVDQDGKRHFPEHARVSSQLWRDAGGPEDVARLIGMDMDIHLLKDEGVPAFVERPECATLLLTGLAEIHSNASMFGGIDSTSFKMKWKALDRRGKKIVELLKGLAVR